MIEARMQEGAGLSQVWEPGTSQWLQAEPFPVGLMWCLAEGMVLVLSWCLLPLEECFETAVIGPQWADRAALHQV